jgi:hypothetical protein
VLRATGGGRGRGLRLRVHLDLVARRQELVESQDQSAIALEQLLHTLDHTFGINPDHQINEPDTMAKNQENLCYGAWHARRKSAPRKRTLTLEI